MTKTYLGLLFLAALAVPLAHGCGDSSFECLGQPVACENREISQCTNGCRVFSGCSGDTVTCESLTDRPMLCVQTGDCRYVGSCQGRPGCENVDYDACAETPGCEQVARCTGSSVTCESLEDSQCELHPQCRLGETCQGEADSCAEVKSSGACTAVPGCFPADTDPAILD